MRPTESASVTECSTREREASGRVACRWLTLFAAIGLVAAASVYAYFEMFGSFAWYDDEGYLMMSVKNLLDGQALYRDVPTFYGPFYYAYEWVWHAVFRLPLTNNATRLLSIGIWLTTGGLAAFAALCLTGRRALAVLVGLLTISHLRTFAHEPGHPQEICTLLIALCVAVAAMVGRRPEALFPLVAGAVAGALAFTKLNVGAFFSVSVVLAALAGTGGGGIRIALRTVMAGCALLLPFALVRSQLGNVWVLAFATLVSLALVPLLRAGRGSPGRATWVDFAGFAGAFALVAAVSVGFALVHGSTLGSLIDGLFVAPMRLAQNIGITGPVSRRGAVMAGASILWMLIHEQREALAARLGFKHYAGIFALLKLMYGLTLFVGFAAGAAWKVLLVGTPFLWLGLIRYPDESRGTAPGFGRLTLCFIAALQPLQAYPIAGSQIAVGTFLLVLVAAVCVGDVLSWTEQRRWVHRLVAPVLASTAFAGILIHHTYRAASHYRAVVPINAPGADWIRVEPDQAATLRWLLASVRAGTDSFFCTTGLNSLHFWSGHYPVSRIFVGNSLNIYSEAQQRELIAALARHPGAIIVFHHGFLPATFATRADNLILRYIEENYTVYDRLNGFELRCLRGQPAPPLQPHSGPHRASGI